ncbi:MAG: histidine kinase [Bacteroidota bacterium]
MFNGADTIDLDADGVKEIVSLDPARLLFTEYRSDLTDPVSIKLPEGRWFNTQYSVINVPRAAPLLSVFNGIYELKLFYKINPFYYSRWLVYLAIFLAIYLFILLIRRIQRNQILKQQKTEKKITELQMKVVRNQMDPHFTMNAVNSVISAINENEKEQATNHLIYFSKMYRHLVLTADKIKCTLAEELDFTRNYLTMEQFRFRDKFDFDFEIQPELNLNLEVPKMVIQSPVENAVKHGLMNLPGKGHLKVRANTSDHILILEITDNGIGRANAARLSQHSTGKGMKAMEEFLKLYQKVTGLKAETVIHDLTDKEGNPAGTKVTVKIQIIRPI